MTSDTLAEGDGTQAQAGKGNALVTYYRGLGLILLGFTLLDLVFMLVAVARGEAGGHTDVLIEATAGVYLLARADRVQREGR